MRTSRFAALQEQTAFSRGDLTPSDVGTKAPAAKRKWRCRFCRTLQRVAAGLVRCVACRQDTVVAGAA